jgi:lysophospholipase L1-like esterase
MEGRRTVRALLIVLGLILVSEVGLRVLTDRDSRWNVRLGADKQFDPLVQFRNRANADYGDGMTTNELGYRAPRNLQHAKPADAIRIIYVGDSNSVTPRRAPFPTQADGLIESALGVNVETVNTAVPGHSSENSRLLFEHEVSKFDADYCVIYLGWNDLGQFGPEGFPYKRHAAGYEISTLQRALSQIYTARFIYALRQVLRQRQPAVNEPMTPEERALYESYRPSHFYDNLRAIVRLAKARYPHVYVLNIATITNEDPTEHELRTAHFPTGMSKNMTKLHYLIGQYNEVVETVTREEGVPMIDFYSLFDSHEARMHFTDSAHFDAQGAALVARAVAERVIADERAKQVTAPGAPSEG